MCLALCHSVWVDHYAEPDAKGRVRHKRRFVSMSPDEEALVRAAASPQIGIVVTTRTTNFIDLAISGELKRQVSCL